MIQQIPRFHFKFRSASVEMLNSSWFAPGAKHPCRGDRDALRFCAGKRGYPFSNAEIISAAVLRIRSRCS